MLISSMKHFVIAALFGFSIAILPTDIRAEFDTEKGWNGHLYASYIIATATLKPPSDSENEEDSAATIGEPTGLLGVTLEADEDDQPIKVTITCDKIMEPSTFTGKFPEKGVTYTINPKIKYRYDQLARHSQTGPVTVTYAVKIGDRDVEEKVETLTLRSVNDCPFIIVDDDAKQDVSYMFAAYVNEQHPFVDKVLREALNTGIVDSFTGYQTKNKSDVYKQTYALWHALSLRDVRYSSITTSVAESENVYSQHVRMIDESINNGQANCVDGSVLMASLLRKVGIEPMLVLVPGHCYLAFALDPEGKELAALETTLIGSVIENSIDVKGLEDVVNDAAEGENSWKTFAAAIATGVNNLNKSAEKFKETDDPQFRLISILEARKLGVLPIGFQSNEKFIATPTDESSGKSANDASDDEDTKD